MFKNAKDVIPYLLRNPESALLVFNDYVGHWRFPRSLCRTRAKSLNGGSIAVRKKFLRANAKAIRRGSRGNKKYEPDERDFCRHRMGSGCKGCYQMACSR